MQINLSLSVGSPLHYLSTNPAQSTSYSYYSCQKDKRATLQRKLFRMSGSTGQKITFTLFFVSVQSVEECISLEGKSNYAFCYTESEFRRAALKKFVLNMSPEMTQYLFGRKHNIPQVVVLLSTILSCRSTLLLSSRRKSLFYFSGYFLQDS